MCARLALGGRAVVFCVGASFRRLVIPSPPVVQVLHPYAANERVGGCGPVELIYLV